MAITEWNGFDYCPECNEFPDDGDHHVCNRTSNPSYNRFLDCSDLDDDDPDTYWGNNWDDDDSDNDDNDDGHNDGNDGRTWGGGSTRKNEVEARAGTSCNSTTKQNAEDEPKPEDEPNPEDTPKPEDKSKPEDTSKPEGKEEKSLQLQIYPIAKTSNPSPSSCLPSSSYNNAQKTFHPVFRPPTDAQIERLMTDFFARYATPTFQYNRLMGSYQFEYDRLKRHLGWPTTRQLLEHPTRDEANRRFLSLIDLRFGRRDMTLEEKMLLGLQPRIRAAPTGPKQVSFALGEDKEKRHNEMINDYFRRHHFKPDADRSFQANYDEMKRKKCWPTKKQVLIHPARDKAIVEFNLINEIIHGRVRLDVPVMGDQLASKTAHTYGGGIDVKDTVEGPTVNATASNEITPVHKTLISAFFAAYPSFDYQPSRHYQDEFQRLLKCYGWPTKREAEHHIGRDEAISKFMQLDGIIRAEKAKTGGVD